MNFRNKPILITGAARSGTSMIAGVIAKSGAWSGICRVPNRYNPKGMFENKAIVDTIIKPLLRKWGCDPMGQNPLPKITYLRKIVDEDSVILKKGVEKVLKDEKYNEEIPWFYKGAKMCLMWPLWAKVFPEATWIIVRRESEDIVNSCLRTNFMKAYKKRSGWLYWVSEHERRFEEMHDAKLNCMEVWPQRMIAGDFTEIQMVINQLGLNWNFDRIQEFVDPGLWRKWKSRRTMNG